MSDNKIPGYTIVPVECCFNCIHFEAHWCQDQDNDKCEEHNYLSAEPNGYCPDFKLNKDISSPNK